MFPIANELWNTVFKSSMLKDWGSPATGAHVITAGPPDVQLVGVVIVSAETKGAASARETLLNAEMKRVAGRTEPTVHTTVCRKSELTRAWRRTLLKVREF